MKTVEIEIKEVEEMVRTIKKNRRNVAKIMKSYREKKFGKGTNEFGQKYSINYLEGIIQAFELSLIHLGYRKKDINNKKTLNFYINDLEKQGME